ncbi:MAG TPA: carbamoyltransferase C-terminal domain-containing protein, partial [archaeon]|nr:carbamoyltransferase C-terminal domain-containing protein [archaeon]
GPEYSRDYIKSFLDREKVKYTEYQDSKKLVKDTAKLLTEEKIIGWFQDRMEWGPRALGNRSILASPLTDKMKDILNAKVKHRELFRPFAPVVPVEDARDWFETDDPVPLPADFMLMVYPIRKEKRKLVPAVTHVDGTGRLQTIRREQNQKYYDVIKEFGRLTGVPILVNTSFKIRGEPIVCKPEEAYRCVMGTGIDYLALGDFLIARSDNPQHMWDSENLSDVLDFK